MPSIFFFLRMGCGGARGGAEEGRRIAGDGVVEKKYQTKKWRKKEGRITRGMTPREETQKKPTTQRRVTSAVSSLFLIEYAQMFHGCALLLVHNCCCCCCYCFRPAQAVDETANFFKCSMNTCRLTSSVNTGAPPSWTNAILQLVENSSQIRPNFNEIND